MRRLAATVLLCLGGCASSSPTSPAPQPTATPVATPVATATPTPLPSPRPTPSGTPADAILRRATFVSDNGYVTTGGAAIVRRAGGHFLDLGADFRTSNSGALDVRLCATAACGPADLDLGPLTRTSGASTYALPDDGGSFANVVIWCRAVRLPFGHGELR